MYNNYLVILYVVVGTLLGFIFAKCLKENDDYEIAGYMIFGAILGPIFAVCLLAFFFIVYLGKGLNYIYNFALEGGNNNS